MARRRKVNEPLPPRPPRKGSFLTRKRSLAPVQPAPGTQLVPVQAQGSAVAPYYPPQQPARPRPLQLHLTDPQLAGGPGQLVPARRRNGDVVSTAFRAAGKAGFRHRWQLAPLAAGGVAAIGAAIDPGLATAALGVAAVAGHVTACELPEQTAEGRRWLSKRERSTFALWAAAAAGWAGGVAANLWQVDPGGLGLLVLATAYPCVRWLWSRRTRTGDVAGETGRLSPRARRLAAGWPDVAGEHGPEALRDSVIVDGSLAEPNEDTIVFTVRLSGVHAKAAATDKVAQALEVILNVGVGTVELHIDRDNASLLKVTLGIGRRLENAVAEWDGPILHPNGEVDLAVTEAGDPIRVRLFNDTGVEHFAIVGPPDTGKSNDLGPLVLPGVIARREVLFYIDGGMGSSSTALAGAIDWWAGQEGGPAWEAVIDSAYSICEARQLRRADLGLDEWHDGEEDDPILTVVIDEAYRVMQKISKDHVTKVSELIRIGRKVGVRVGQITHDPMGADWIGGRDARDFMIGEGCQIAHRQSSATAAYLAAGGSSDKVDLRDLPPDPGWAAIQRKGKWLTKKGRVRFANKDRIRDEILAGFTPRTLTDEDLLAAGPAYRNRTTGTAAAASQKANREARANRTTPAAPANDSIENATGESGAFPVAHFAQNRADTTEPALTIDQQGRRHIDAALSSSQRAAANVAAMNRNRLLEIVTAAGRAGVRTTGVITASEIPKTTAIRLLDELAAAGHITRGEDKLWRPATVEGVA